MVEEIEYIDRKKLKFPQLRANKMLVLLKKLKHCQNKIIIIL